MTKSTGLEIPADLSIPAFLKRGKNYKRPENKKVVTVHEDRNPIDRFVPIVLPDKKKKRKVTVKRQVSVQDHIRQKGNFVIGELEGMIDDGIITPEWSLYDHLRKKEISNVIAKRVAEHFEPIANEILEAITLEDDEDLQYAYRRYSPEELTNMGIMYQGLVDEANRYAVNMKKVRKIRKRKLPSMEKVLKNFVYAKTDNTYKLASIDPSKIIGAAALWVFHPKSKVLTVYRALDRGGLGIKRTTITNVDEKESVSKRMGRKTQERLDTVLNGGKITLRKLMDTFIGEKLKLTRITKNHVLLRVE